MTTTRSDYLPAIFGQPAEQDDFFAEDITTIFAKPDYNLLGHALGDVAPVGDRLIWANLAWNSSAPDHSELLAKRLPGAVWYLIEDIGGDVQFIVRGDTVWISRQPCPSHERAVRVSKGEALAAIYGMIDKVRAEMASANA